MANGSTSGAAITGHFALVYPTKYIKAADLRGKDVTVTIARVTWEALVMAGGKRDRKAAVHMTRANGQPIEKKWIVGKTVMGQIAKATNERDVSKWAGHAVTLYPTECRGGGGELMECIRVRVKVDARATEIPEDMAAAPLPSAAFDDDAQEAES